MVKGATCFPLWNVSVRWIISNNDQLPSLRIDCWVQWHIMIILYLQHFGRIWMGFIHIRWYFVWLAPVIHDIFWSCAFTIIPFIFLTFLKKYFMFPKILCNTSDFWEFSEFYHIFMSYYWIFKKFMNICQIFRKSNVKA